MIIIALRFRRNNHPQQKSNSEKIKLIRGEFGKSLIREGEMLEEDEENNFDKNGFEMKSDVIDCYDFLLDENEEDEDNSEIMLRENRDKDKEEMKNISVKTKIKSSTLICKSDKFSELFSLFFFILCFYSFRIVLTYLLIYILII